MSESSSATASTGDLKITLLTNIRHHGKICRKGSHLTVDKAFAKQLLARGYAKKTPGPKSEKRGKSASAAKPDVAAEANQSLTS